MTTLKKKIDTQVEIRNGLSNKLTDLEEEFVKYKEYMEKEKGKVEKVSSELDNKELFEKDLFRSNQERIGTMAKRKTERENKDDKLNEKNKKVEKMQKQVEGIDGDTKDEHEKLIISANELKKIKNEVEGYKKIELANEEYKKKLEKDNFHYGRDCTETGIKCLEIKNTIQAKDEVIQQLKRKNSEFEEKLKQQISM
mmetsp:Transcript_18246/g.14863  ORF Transcript_18246/g.14863 Transcript_18246/m.14863 type:complete len:197 (-) Transcript_18246:1335-1925(-)